MHIVILFFFFCRLQQHQSRKCSFQWCLLVSNILRHPWSQQGVVTAARGLSHPVKALRPVASSHSRTQLQVQVVAWRYTGCSSSSGLWRVQRRRWSRRRLWPGAFVPYKSLVGIRICHSQACLGSSICSTGHRLI